MERREEVLHDLNHDGRPSIYTFYIHITGHYVHSTHASVHYMTQNKTNTNEQMPLM